MNIDQSLVKIKDALNKDLAATDLVINRRLKNDKLIDAACTAVLTIPEVLILRGVQEILLRRCNHYIKTHS
jgi:hypothetical protein